MSRSRSTSPRELPHVDVDPDRLIQVIVNLVSNAVKFCDKAQGRVIVRVRAGAGGACVVDVADNGVGIAPTTSRRSSSASSRPAIR